MRPRVEVGLLTVPRIGETMPDSRRRGWDWLGWIAAAVLVVGACIAGVVLLTPAVHAHR